MMDPNVVIGGDFLNGDGTGSFSIYGANFRVGYMRSILPDT